MEDWVNDKYIMSNIKLEDIPKAIDYPHTFSDRTNAVKLTDVRVNEYIQKGMAEVKKQIKETGKAHYCIGTGDTIVEIVCGSSKGAELLGNVITVKVVKLYSENIFINTIL